MAYFLYKILYSPDSIFSFLRLFSYISFRSIFAFLTAFIVTLVLARMFITYFTVHGFRESRREKVDFGKMNKKGTPTMGGIIIIISIFIPFLIWCNMENRFNQILIIALIWFGAIGFADDILKIRMGKSDVGLSRKSKLILQGFFGLVLALVILYSGYSPYIEGIKFNLYIPFYKSPLMNLSWIYVPFIIFVVIAIANAVNFADGMDGLAIVPASVTTGVYGVFAYILGRVDYSSYLLYNPIPGAGEITVFCAAVIGAGLGFLWYNSYPAEIFMGDSGSQALGGIIATMAILIKQEFLFLIAGGIFLAEAFSVLLQERIGISWLGKRIFYRAPLHHTFQHRGIAEPTIVVRFWIVSIILALLSFATLKIR